MPCNALNEDIVNVNLIIILCIFYINDYQRPYGGREVKRLSLNVCFSSLLFI